MFETSTWLGSFLTNFGSGAVAGVTAVAMTYPLDTIRARLSFQVKGEHKYKGIIDAGITIVRSVSHPVWLCDKFRVIALSYPFLFCFQEGGVLALYRGFVPTLCGIFPQAGCNFYFFEQLKNMCMQYFPLYTCNVREQNTGKSGPSKQLSLAVYFILKLFIVYIIKKKKFILYCFRWFSPDHSSQAGLWWCSWCGSSDLFVSSWCHTATHAAGYDDSRNKEICVSELLLLLWGSYALFI